MIADETVGRRTRLLVALEERETGCTATRHARHQAALGRKQDFLNVADLPHQGGRCGFEIVATFAEIGGEGLSGAEVVAGRRGRRFGNDCALQQTKLPSRCSTGSWTIQALRCQAPITGRPKS